MNEGYNEWTSGLCISLFNESARYCGQSLHSIKSGVGELDIVFFSPDLARLHHGVCRGAISLM